MSTTIRLGGVLLAAALSLPVSLCAVNYYENDQHNNYIAYDYATGFGLLRALKARRRGDLH